MKPNKTIHLYTEAGRALAGIPWDRYPRPQMRRDSFFCLNGEWDFSANGGAWTWKDQFKNKLNAYRKISVL